jgi:hypothetical protein
MLINNKEYEIKSLDATSVKSLDATSVKSLDATSVKPLGATSVNQWLKKTNTYQDFSLINALQM